MKNFKTYNKTCSYCNSSFIAKKSTVKYCSAKCNNKVIYINRDIDAYNARKRKTSNAGQRKFRYNNDINFKLACVLRARLKTAVKNNHKSGSAINDLGCTIDELKAYLESKFQPGMSWSNYGRFGWHIDHVIPLTAFDLTNNKELKKACHYTNLQPLEWRQNIIKGGA